MIIASLKLLNSTNFYNYLVAKNKHNPKLNIQQQNSYYTKTSNSIQQHNKTYNKFQRMWMNLVQREFREMNRSSLYKKD